MTSHRDSCQNGSFKARCADDLELKEGSHTFDIFGFYLTRRVLKIQSRRNGGRGGSVFNRIAECWGRNGP